MQSFGSRLPQDFSNAHVMMDFRPTDLRPTKQRQSSLTKYGSFIGKIIPRIPSRPLRAVGIFSSRPRPPQSISSLAAAATLINIGFAQTPGTPLLSESAGFSLRSVLATPGIGLPVPGISTNQQRNPSQPPKLPALYLDDIPARIMNRHNSSDLSPSHMHTTGSESHPTPVVDSDVRRLPRNLGRAVPALPSLGIDALGLPFNETNVNIHPTPIPPYIRSLMRPPNRTDSISNTMTHNNQRFLAGLPNRSASSLLTTASYVTAPTSPPPSIRSLPRCESPTPLSMLDLRARVQSFQTSSLRHSVLAGEIRFEVPWPSGRVLNRNSTSDKPWSSTSNASSTSDSPSRKILIIGSSYKGHGQVKKMFSIETLDGALEDRNRLGTCFKERGYSVQTLFEEGFNRKRALARVEQFLEDAERGDVRAIVFTVHGYTDGNGTVSLVPPQCSEKSELITRAEWDQNIRKHSRPGAIV
ncbi:hypothetical protein RSAG8_05703, partial [Rhizoctonia solani AG-8 WAC10335]